ncbi:PorV/PorQ family protein, partial [bacterium]
MKEARMQAPKPGWIDALALALCRPWVLTLAAVLLLTPSGLLLAALNSGAAFLKIGTGARPAALGGAYTAIAGDVDAMYYNPGGLANLSRRELGATHAEWLLGTRFDFIGFAQPTSHGTFGLGVTRLATGGQEGRDANRQATTGFEAADTAYTLSYSRRLPDLKSSSVGANLKLLRSEIGGYSAQTVAVDLGVQHRFADKPLSLGASVLNIGRGMKFMEQRDPLPLTLSLGAAYRVAGPLNLAFDIRRDIYDQRTDIGIGTEYALLPSFALRMG